MSESSNIAWTHHTFNPWWGCTKVSPGCAHCYAEAFAKRVGSHTWGVGASRRFFSDKHWSEPQRWNDAAEAVHGKRLVFCASMADVFEDRADLEPHRARLWGVIESTPWLIWQLLTKRPENVMKLAPDRWMNAFPDNVWIGTTCEDKTRFAERVPHLLDVPARLRFLSCEPLLEHLGDIDLNGIGWVIVGGESGHPRRRFEIRWLQEIAKRAGYAGVPLFVKQDGGRYPGGQGAIPDGLWSAKNFPMGWGIDATRIERPLTGTHRGAGEVEAQEKPSKQLSLPVLQ